ncbi:High frequency lysogenization protein HflD [uncultured Gammaproteobacteria bacterium]|nr:High frequency lysogenization protein HflD [uncultured Gammaproteobacteria bacterium]
MNKLHKQTLALASLLQSATLVDQLARTGVCDSKSDKASLRSLITNSTNVEEVFNSPKDLSVGLNSLKTVFSKGTKNNQHIALYSLTLISLEKKLMKNKAFLSKISTEIETIKKQDFFDIGHSNSLARLAELYKSTLGKLNPTIMVNGEQIYLSNKRTSNHIRALLLAGIRAVSLWKSQGGKTWHLLFNKKQALKLINTIDF